MRPILMHHGLFGFDKIELARFRLNYWGNIPELLTKLGYKVYLSKVSKTHSIEQRSQELYEYIQKNNLENAHLLCHSLGGLDARYMLHSRKLQIPTITTIGTPHHGSEFMDLLNRKLGLGYRYDPNLSKPNTLAYHFLYYLDQPAYSCLTTKYCSKFNESIKENKFTKYYSVGASFKCDNEKIHHIAKQIVDNDVTNMPLLSILGLKTLQDYMDLLERIMYNLSGDNDGLVSLKSSKYGQYLKTLSGSHWDLVDKSGRFGNKMEENVEKLYVDIVNLLKSHDA
eukprot:NODE_130_length_16779_cov_1.687410.p7 type:complete len:283 gc:universal NODE_130_length_16779_cov_1.687410:6548-5700(-)